MLTSPNNFYALNMNKVQHYERLLSTKETNIFILPKGHVILRGISDCGNLVKYTSEAEYKKKGKKKLWITLKLKIFRNKNGEFYDLYKCNHCEKMESVDLLALNNDKSDVAQYKCLHSRVCEIIVKKRGNWQDLWNVKLDNVLPSDELFDPSFPPMDHNYLTLREDNLFLAACYNSKNNEMTLLSTLTTKFKIPDCSKCSVRGCRCFKAYKAAMLEMHKDKNPNDNSLPDLFCNRFDKKRHEANQRLLKRNTANNFSQYHNKQVVMYPIFRDPVMLDIFNRSQKDEVILPKEFIPNFSANLRCVHGHMYEESNTKLVIMSKTITIFGENFENVKNISNIGRPTVGGCRCRLQTDTTMFCLWNMGASKFIKMDYLLQVVHKFENLSAIEAAFKARSDQFSSLGVPTELNSKNACSSVTGFCEQLSFSKEDWMCDDCGETPEMLGMYYTHSQYMILVSAPVSLELIGSLNLLGLGWGWA